jgi:hypothetical protein
MLKIRMTNGCDASRSVGMCRLVSDKAVRSKASQEHLSLNPSGFQSPPRVGCPKRVVRSAQSGPHSFAVRRGEKQGGRLRPVCVALCRITKNVQSRKSKVGKYQAKRRDQGRERGRRRWGKVGLSSSVGPTRLNSLELAF